MESKDHISESVKEEVRIAMETARETIGIHRVDLPPHLVGLSKVYEKFFLENFEEYATKIYSKVEEMYMQGLVEKTSPENDGLENTQPQKTHGANVVHPTCTTSTIEKPEEAGISKCGPEITKEMATTEQQRLIAEVAKMNEEMLNPNTVESDSGLCLKNQTLDEEVFTLHEKPQLDSDRSLKKPRYELVMKDDDDPQAEQPDAQIKAVNFEF